MWNRILVLSKFGVQINLITWSDQPVSEEQTAILKKHVKVLFILPRYRYPLLALHPKYPPVVISRHIPTYKYREILKELSVALPDLIFLDGIQGFLTAFSLAEDLKSPLVYRSHNVEYQYLRELYKTEQKLTRKILLYLNIGKTYEIEYFIRKHATLVYDISQKDSEVWREFKSLPESKVLNPCFLFDGFDEADNNLYAEPDIDVLFIGNLHTSNNVHGLCWFVGNVAPLLDGLTTTIAGSNPSREVMQLVGSTNIKIVANPIYVKPLYRRARVLINPVWHGSGINIKIIEMLATGKPIVSTPSGVAGLSPSLKPFVAIESTPHNFAEAIKAALSKTLISKLQREAVIKEYGMNNAKTMVGELRSLIERSI